ncbi:serine/threonine protein kinase, partial [Streptomyces sp. AC536]|nr:serine/threonine protein kinase [Streptomyces buecherae]
PYPPQQQRGPAPAPYAPPQQPQHPQPQQPRRRQQQPQPQRYAPPPPAPEPAAPARREPRQRSANAMRIPGLGCLKGCLFVIIILFVGAWLVWELTPLQDWVADGKSFWQATKDWVTEVKNWISDLGGPS